MKKTVRVLNLDDNEAARYVRTRALAQAGFEVIEASTGADALSVIKHRPPDIALLDVQLPDMSGLEVCRKIKTNQITSGIPVVQISAAQTAENDESASLEYGADIYLTGPTEPIVLITVIRTLLKLRETESVLLDSEERFKTVVNQATAGIAQTDLLGRFIYVNHRYCDIVGRYEQELYSLKLGDMVHIEDREQHRHRFEELVRRGISYTAEVRFLRPDGRVIWTSNSVSLVRDRIGIPQGAMTVVIDISERKHAEETARFLAEVSEKLAELTDQTHAVQKVTDAIVPFFADWVTLDLSEAEGRHQQLVSSEADISKSELSRVLENTDANQGTEQQSPGSGKAIPQRQPEHVEDILRALSMAGVVERPHLLRLADLGLKSYLCVPLLSRDGAMGSLAMGIRNSARRYNAADLAVAQELGHRVSVAIENASLFEALRMEGRRKDEFLATLAHELRNPLAPLRNALQIMRIKADDPQAVEQSRLLMDRQLSQLQRLVDDLLDVSRINTGKVDLRSERVALSAIINTALETVRQALEARHELTVILPRDEVYVYGDPARLAQVVTNLLDNAGKYTPPRGHITLSVARSGEQAVITVTDTGFGISADMLPKVFDMFTQASQSIGRASGGLGIGLTLVKRIVEMHAGTIEAHSEGLDRGSSFSVHLRLAPDQSAPSTSAANRNDDQAQSAGQRRVLVVDDNVDAADSLAELLRLMGHEVHIANDGMRALEVARQQRPEIIFLDIGLPELSGYEVARRLRLDDACKHAFIAALSGYGSKQDKQRSVEAGFDLHINKPIDFSQLEQIVANRR